MLKEERREEKRREEKKRKKKQKKRKGGYKLPDNEKSQKFPILFEGEFHEVFSQDI